MRFPRRRHQYRRRTQPRDRRAGPRDSKLSSGPEPGRAEMGEAYRFRMPKRHFLRKYRRVFGLKMKSWACSLPSCGDSYSRIETGILLKG